MGATVGGDFKFCEINSPMLAACETGHGADVWTRPEYETINIYLDGFPMGQGKVAALKKSDNPGLAILLESGASVRAEIIKQSATNFQIVFKKRSEEDVLRDVALAREQSETAASKLYAAERELRAITIQKLLSAYKPASSQIQCSLRTPSPVRLDPGEDLVLVPKTAEYYAGTSSSHIIFIANRSKKIAYVKASSEVRIRILRAHFNGYAVTACVTGVAAGPHSHGLASVWDEFESNAEVKFSGKS